MIERNPIDSGSQERAKDTILVVTHDGRSNPEIDNFIQKSRGPSVEITYVSPAELPSNPEGVQEVILNMSPQEHLDLSGYKGIPATRLVWNKKEGSIVNSKSESLK